MGAGFLGDRLGPFVGLRYDIEFGRRRRISDLPQLDFQPEEADAFFCDLVEPVKGRPMFVREILSHPNDSNSLGSGRVCEQLAKVLMIGSFQLMFNQHPSIRADSSAQDIGPKGADLLFHGFDFKFEPQRFPQQCNIVGARKPWREVLILRTPNFAQFHALEASEFLIVHFQPFGGSDFAGLSARILYEYARLLRMDPSEQALSHDLQFLWFRLTIAYTPIQSIMEIDLKNH